MSRPLAATSVQTRMAEFVRPALPSISVTPLLNLSRFFSLCFCCILECRQQFLIFRKSSMLFSRLVAVIALQNMMTDSPYFCCRKQYRYRSFSSTLHLTAYSQSVSGIDPVSPSPVRSITVGVFDLNFNVWQSAANVSTTSGMALPCCYLFLSAFY